MVAHSGYDLPEKVCPACGTTMRGDGHNLPYTEHKAEDRMIPEINIAASKIEKAWQLLVDYVGEKRIARSGSVSIAGRRANGYIQRYQDSCGEVFTKEKATQIIKKIMNIKVSEWSMPGGFLLLPEGMAFEDITPITHLDSLECGIHRRSHLNGYDIDYALQRINLLGYSIYDRITELHCITGTNPKDIEYSDPNIYKLFENFDVCGIPNFSTDSCKQIMRSVVAQNIDTPAVLRFSDLVRILGINHGLGTWKDNAANLIKTQPFADLIGSREDIFLKLQEYGVDPLTVCTVTETIRKGKFYADTDENLATAQKLLDTGVPQWYVESMRKIGYLTSKAHTAHIVKTAVSLAWFKAHYPKEFYTVTLQDLGAEEFLHYSNEALLQKLNTIETWDPSKDASQEAIELLLEMRHRNIPINL
jgi:DNA polymerase-3 subunit alpha (Gram-positive type)